MASISIPGAAERNGALAYENRAVPWAMVEACERVASAGLLLALTPLLAGAAVGVTLLSRRSPFIAHRRVGWRGSTLWMLKLRTMWGGNTPATGLRRGFVEYIDDVSGPAQKGPADARVTGRFARFCRLHSLDELPQLWHVVRGEMSLVGPRPLTAAELRRHYGRDAAEVLQHKPGIAGLWQVSGRNRLSYAQRRTLDLKLVRNRSLRTYWKILLRTIPEILGGKNTW